MVHECLVLTLPLCPPSCACPRPQPPACLMPPPDFAALPVAFPMLREVSVRLLSR